MRVNGEPLRSWADFARLLNGPKCAERGAVESEYERRESWIDNWLVCEGGVWRLTAKAVAFDAEHFTQAGGPSE